MLSRRIDLRFPIELPGGTVASVAVRSLSHAGYDLALTGEEGQLEAFADCIGLPAGVAAEMDDVDYDRVARAIAKLNREEAEAVLANRPKPFTVIKGDKP
jgi:hypothetical protein